MASKLANIVTVILHPVILPTLGFLLLLNSGFYFSYINWEAKRLILIVVFFSTAILPLMMMSILSLNPKFRLSIEKGGQRALTLLISSVSYYLGYMLLARLNAIPLLKVLMIAAVMVLLGLLFLSFWWKISSHMAALGSLTGILLALSFRTGTYPIWSIIAVILASGITATSLLLLSRNKLWHLEAGYALGFTIFYLVIYFI
ncbi:MAG TPA: hypothetical protein VFD91_00135 [Mariniphaga sp.]|nr:hypothetical protein [Mariniphaga sp.]